MKKGLNDNSLDHSNIHNIILISDTEKLVLDSYVNYILERVNITRETLTEDKKVILDKFLPKTINTNCLEFQLELSTNPDNSETISIEQFKEDPYKILTNINKVFQSNSIIITDHPFRSLIDGKASNRPDSNNIENKIRQAQNYMSNSFFKEISRDSQSGYLTDATAYNITSNTKLARN